MGWWAREWGIREEAVSHWRGHSNHGTTFSSRAEGACSPYLLPWAQGCLLQTKHYLSLTQPPSPRHSF